MKIDINKLGKLNFIAKEGANRVAENLSGLLGINVEMKISRIDFATLDDASEELGNEHYIGVYLDFLGLLSGVLLVVFPKESAKKIAKLMLLDIGENVDKERFSDIEISAIGEVGNILTSSFVDGFANVFGGEIDISTPNSFEGNGRKLLTHILDRTKSDNVFIFRTLIYARNENVLCQILMFPDLEKLVEVLESVEL